MLVLATLGLSGGIPNLLATSLAPTWATVVGWSVTTIGLLAFLQLPYALKFLWAPIVDHVRLPLLGRLGRRRSWILLTQAAVALAIGAIAWVGPHQVGPFMVLLAALVLFSATQDIVADAYRAESLKQSEFGAGAATFVSGYRVAFVVLGGGVLAFASTLTWPVAVGALAAVCVLAMIGPAVAREPARTPDETRGATAAVSIPFTQLWSRWRWRVFSLVVFVLIFRLPDQMGNAMTAPLLIKGLGYTTEQLGWVRQVLGFGLTILGALAGGWMVARIGILKCLLVFGILQALSNGGFLLLAQMFSATTAHEAATPAPIGALIGVIAIENFSGGLVSAGFVAFLMSVCDRTQVATQYALLTALMALGGAIAGGFSGYLTAHLDYPAFFVVTILAGIPGIALIAAVRSPR